MSTLTRPPMSARIAAVVVAAAAVAGVAGCGGGDSAKSTGAAPGKVASFVPAGAPVYAEVSTDFDGPQWTQVKALAAKFPAFPDLQKKITEGLGSNGVQFDRDIKPLLGKDAALGILKLSGKNIPNISGSDGTPSVPSVGSAASQPVVVAVEIAAGKEQQVVDFVKKDAAPAGTVSGVQYYKPKDSSEPLIAVTDGAVVLASTVSELQASLDAHSAGGSKTIAGDAKVTDTLGKLPADVFAQLYVDVGAAFKQTTESSSQLKQLEQLGLTTDTAFGLSLSAEATGVRLKGVVTGSGSSTLAGASEFTPSLTANVPGDALAYVGFSNLAGTVSSLVGTLAKSNPDLSSQIQALSSQVPLLLGGATLDDLKALTSKEHALVVTRGGAFPAVSLLLQVDDAARAQKTLDGLKKAVPLVAGQLNGGKSLPDWQTITEAGVTGQELPLSPKANVVYGAKGGLAVIGTQPSSLALLNAPATSLQADQDFTDATVGMPDKVGSLAWIDVQGIVETADALGAFKSTGADAKKVLANLKPVKSLVAWSTVADGVPTVEAFLTVK
jgi:uncharacterized protein DUF3352